MVQLDIQEQILEKLNALVVVLNNDGNAEYVSQSAGQLLGYDPNHLMGNNWWEVTRFSKPEGERTKNKILALLRKSTNSTEIFEHLFKTSYGGQKWIRWKTYDRAMEKFDRYDSVLDEGVLHSAAKLGWCPK